MPCHKMPLMPPTFLLEIHSYSYSFIKVIINFQTFYKNVQWQNIRLCCHREFLWKDWNLKDQILYIMISAFLFLTRTGQQMGKICVKYIKRFWNLTRINKKFIEKNTPSDIRLKISPCFTINHFLFAPEKHQMIKKIIFLI